MNEARIELTLAAGFLTRLRLPEVPYSDAAMARAVQWYPTVGLGIGIALAILFWLASLVLPQPIAAMLTIACGMLLTGALHEDGLADVADGLGGDKTRDRALEIMRDSNIGTYGTLALGLTLAIKVTALSLLPLEAALTAIIAGHTLGRYAMAWLMQRLAYARPQGAAGFTHETMPTNSPTLWAGGILGWLALVVGAGILPALATLVAMAALNIFIARYVERKLGGYTGDVLGATEQLVEALIPLTLLIWL